MQMLPTLSNFLIKLYNYRSYIHESIELIETKHFSIYRLYEMWKLKKIQIVLGNISQIYKRT